MAYGCGYAGGYSDANCEVVTAPGTRGTFAGAKFGSTVFGGTVLAPPDYSATDEEYAGHEYAGTFVNSAAAFPLSLVRPQTFGCGNGYAGGAFSALLFGGGVPCHGEVEESSTALQIKSNVEDFCILDIRCA